MDHRIPAQEAELSEFVIRGARALLPGGFEAVDVAVSDGRIAALDMAGNLPVVDGRGLIVAPALVDVHGDAFERQVMPRDGVFVPLETALMDTDRQLAANGIATAYHALTLGWEPGLRSVERGAAFVDGLAAAAPRLTVENRVQLRWETFAFEALPLIERALVGPLTPSLAFNDHTSMAMRAFGSPVQARGFELSPDFETASLDDARLKQRTAKYARRSGLEDDAYVALLGQVWARRGEVPETIRALAGKAAAAGAPMLSHDDTTAETRAFYRGVGARTAEFPMTLEAAEAARAAGDALIFGAPNAMRGGSHINSLAAGEMVEAGLCDALASDYFYPAMHAALARLDHERRADRAALWRLVSEGPARAMGLADRGRIAVGLRADLVLVDWPEAAAPAIRATWVAGRAAYAAKPMGAAA
ncbi:MAG: alpha-D-ribose 1-methylphosphonate 5-triphosphate diphosphatase [Pseudomonadota bacterium]